jgi:hypothetical protein
MSSSRAILEQLKLVDQERAARDEEVGLNEKVRAIKTYQQQRFRQTYADLLLSPRYGPASRFFLKELYGPDDFSQRDGQFARVVPTMVRLFPAEIVNTVAALAELHALSERLDTLMGRRLKRLPIDALTYIEAWRETACEAERAQQINLTLGVASALDGLTQKPLVRNSLRLMRRPARAAGLGELQQFLEAGFDTFKAMNGASEFLAMVETREKALAIALFGASASQTKGENGLEEAIKLLPPVVV